MKKRLFSLVMGAILLSLGLVLASCAGENPLVGRWQDQYGDTLEFFSDGNGVWDEEAFTWSSERGRLRVEFSIWGFNEVEVFDYEVSHNTLTIREDGEDWIFNRIR